jgi:hypothetical protein
MAKHSVSPVWLGSLSDRSTAGFVTSALRDSTSEFYSILSGFGETDQECLVTALGCGTVVSKQTLSGEAFIPITSE